jgi:hypothetical protein
MQIGSNKLYIIAAIILIAAIIAYFTMYYRAEGNIADIAKGPFDLSKKAVIIPTETAKKYLFSTNEFTLSFFIKLDGHDKTSRINGQPISIIQQTGTWGMQYIPSKNPAYLFEIKRLGTDANGAYINQIINLPPLPQRKWVYVSILREGRRIDILYNDEIVGSAYLNTFPVVSSKPVEIGNPSLSGVIALVNGASRRYTPDDIRAERAARADTRGKPYLAESSFDVSLPTFECSGDSCNKPEFVNKPTKSWSSPYA